MKFLNIERTDITISVISEHLSPTYQKLGEKFSLKNPKIYKEYMSSLTFFFFCILMNFYFVMYYIFFTH